MRRRVDGAAQIDHSDTMQTLSDKHRAEVVQAMRRKASKRGRIPTKYHLPQTAPKPQAATARQPQRGPEASDADPQTKNIEVAVPQLGKCTPVGRKADSDNLTRDLRPPISATSHTKPSPSESPHMHSSLSHTACRSQHQLHPCSEPTPTTALLVSC